MSDHRNELPAPPHTEAPAGMKDEVSQDGIVCTAAGPAPRSDIPTRGYVWFSWIAPILAAASTFTALFSGGVVPSFGGFAVSDAVIICAVLLLITLLNFIVMTALWARQRYDAKGLLATIIVWSAAGLYIWAPFSISHPQLHKRHPDDEHKLWAAALGSDLSAFQKAVDRYGPDSEPSALDSLYNVLILRGKTDFVRTLQAGIPTHLSSLALASNYRVPLEPGPLLHCATGAQVGPPLNGMAAALFGPQPELRQLVLDYANRRELHYGLHQAIRADAPELVAELLQRGVSLHRAVLMQNIYESREDGPISRLTLIKFLIEARAAQVLKWFLTDGRPHFDALDAARKKGEAGALHLWARSAGLDEAYFGTFDNYLPVLDVLLAEPTLRGAAPLDPQACRDNCKPAGFKTSNSITMQVNECGLQCGPVEIAWGSGGVRSVQALIDRGLPISSDPKRRKLILAALQAPADPAVGEAQQMRPHSHQGEATTPDITCLDAFLAKQAAGQQQR